MVDRRTECLDTGFGHMIVLHVDRDLETRACCPVSDLDCILGTAAATALAWESQESVVALSCRFRCH